MFSKHLFYVTADRLCAYRWRRGKLSAGRLFEADSGGMEAFGRYLDDDPRTPAYLVADLVEEDFQRQLLPHVGGRARRELIGRRLQQLYRDTPYRLALVQGREPNGRRDDQLLFSALTNPGAVQPWALMTEQRRVPLAGVYSTVFLSALLVRRLAVAQEHLLLITQQSSGLRQSYFQGRHLKFSRLTEIGAHDRVAAHIAAETTRMQQFLTSTRLIGRGDLLRVVVLAPAAQLPELEAACEDGAEIAFQFIDMHTAAARLKLDAVPQLADQLLLTLAGSGAPASHYPLGPQERFFQLWQARVGLYAVSAALGAVALLWVGVDVWHGVQDQRNSGALLAAAQADDARFHRVMASLLPRAARTANMKAAVLLEGLVAAQGPAPGALVAMLSEALDRAPAITLTAIDWKVEQAAAAANGTGGGSEPIAASALGIGRAPLQVMRVEGEIAGAQGSYRATAEAMDRFAADLARQPRLRVEVLKPPLDLRPNVTLSGKAGLAEPDSKPKFALRLSWTPS
jgi:hypothetical protein